MILKGDREMNNLRSCKTPGCNGIAIPKSEFCKRCRIRQVKDGCVSNAQRRRIEFLLSEQERGRK